MARASQPDNLPFPSCGRRALPILAASIHLQSGDGKSLPATKLYLSVFTCPTQRVLISRRTPARALPARQHYLFKSHAQATLTRPTQQVLCSPRTSARASQPDKLTVSVCPHHNIETPSNATYPVGQAILAFSPPPVRLNHPTREY